MLHALFNCVLGYLAVGAVCAVIVFALARRAPVRNDW